MAAPPHWTMNTQGQRDTHSPGGPSQGQLPASAHPASFSTDPSLNSCGLQWSESEGETEARGQVLAQVTQLRLLMILRGPVCQPRARTFPLHNTPESSMPESLRPHNHFLSGETRDKQFGEAKPLDKGPEQMWGWGGDVDSV